MIESLDPHLGELLRLWPGRFRHRALLVALHAPDPAGPQQLARALVEGIAAEDDEHQVYESLLAEGHFALAETVLTDCAALDRARLDDLSRRLETVRERRHAQLRARLEETARRADLAGIEAPAADRDELAARCRESWPEAAAALTALEDELAAGVAAGRAALDARLAALPDAEEGWAAACRALIEAGSLRAAKALLDRSDDHSGGPAAVPPLPEWCWKEEPAEILRWHLDPATRRAPSFAGWAVRQGSAEHRLLDAYQSLQLAGGARPAVDFATALDEFLGEGPRPRTAHPVEGGHLTRLFGVFADEDLAAFRPAGDVDLFVADPGTRAIPALPGLAPFLAVGWGLDGRGYAGRSQAAVLDLRSLLRLAAARRRRAVGLLRVAGPRWPLAAFTGGRVFAEPKSSWRTLSWIVDLSGLGDLGTAASLAYETGLHPDLIRLFLDHLLRSPRRLPAGAGALPRWTDDAQLAAALRAAVLAPVRGNPAAEAAFWAALSLRTGDAPVGVNEMMREIALVCARVDPVGEDALWAGAARLAALPVVREVTPGGVLLDDNGVLTGLAADAGKHLAEALERLAAETPGPDRPALDAWALHRHLLTPGLAGYRADPGPERARALAEETAALPLADLPLGGEADLLGVLGRIRPDFETAHPGVELTIAVPAGTVAAVRADVLQVLLYELLGNAAEALGASGGSIRLRAESAHGDVTVEVQDSGPGIADTAGDHRIFRRGFSTRGPGRGDGLHRARTLAQQADGDLLLAARRGVHPVLQGAHFTLVLPMP
ncbi:ATP-binding protein [Kitasatospora sp. NPDC094028]